MDIAPAWDQLLSAANQLAEVLAARGERIALAESCTCGLSAAALGTVPGISAYLCGSTVAYRDATKSAWLGIDPHLIQRESAVSAGVTAAMALHVLARTPESQWAAAVTGHLGPEAPAEADGLVFVAVAQRQALANRIVSAASQRLDVADRVPRQYAAARLLLQCARRAMYAATDSAASPTP